MEQLREAGARAHRAEAYAAQQLRARLRRPVAASQLSAAGLCASHTQPEGVQGLRTPAPGVPHLIAGWHQHLRAWV